MNIREIGLSTSAFGYTMGSTGKNTPRKNPNPWSLEKFLDFAAFNGFGGIEAPLRRFVPDLNQAPLEKLKSQLADHQMFFLMDAETALDVEEITAVMPWAQEFGSSIIRIKTSNILSAARKKLGRPWKEHLEHCVGVLKSLAPKLRENNLKIALENHQDLDSHDLADIIEAVGSDVVGANFDIGNAFSVCEDPLVFGKKLGSSIINIHLKDYKIFQSEEGFRLVRCPLGEGSVDFKAILPELARSSPNAKMVVELGALEARNIAWLAPDFWQEIHPRDPSELRAFYQLLEREMIKTGGDVWKTPWEKEQLPEEVMAFEAAELQKSLSYLSTI
jgi:sugar phosphate isomerase/epimerase